MKIRYVVHVPSGRFGEYGSHDVRPPMVAGPNDPVTGQPTQVPDPNYVVAEFDDADLPNPKLHRYDPVTGGKRLATAQELADAKDANALERAQHTSREKDIATWMAYLIRRQNVAAWNAMSNADKKTAVLAQCDAWRDLRALVEKIL